MLSGLLQSLGSFYESLSVFEIIVIIILVLVIGTCLTVYISYRIIKRRFLKRLELARRIITSSVEKLSTSNAGNDQKDGAPDTDTNISKDIHELLEELGEESLWFSIAAYFYKRRFKESVEENEPCK